MDSEEEVLYFTASTATDGNLFICQITIATGEVDYCSEMGGDGEETPVYLFTNATQLLLYGFSTSSSFVSSGSQGWFLLKIAQSLDLDSSTLGIKTRTSTSHVTSYNGFTSASLTLGNFAVTNGANGGIIPEFDSTQTLSTSSSTINSLATFDYLQEWCHFPCSTYASL